MLHPFILLKTDFLVEAQRAKRVEWKKKKKEERNQNLHEREKFSFLNALALINMLADSCTSWKETGVYSGLKALVPEFLWKGENFLELKYHTLNLLTFHFKKFN